MSFKVALTGFTLLVWAASIAQAAEPASCESLRAQATAALKASSFEPAAAALEQFLAGGCEARLQDSIDLIFAHYKSAGYDGGAMNRSINESLAGKGGFFRLWLKEQGSREFTAAELGHVERATELHESLPRYYEKDAYFFRVMMLRMYHSFYVAAFAPENALTDELAARLLLNFKKASAAFAQTTKYTPEILGLIAQEAASLDRDRSGSATAGELLAYVRRIR